MPTPPDELEDDRLAVAIGKDGQALPLSPRAVRAHMTDMLSGDDSQVLLAVVRKGTDVAVHLFAPPTPALADFMESLAKSVRRAAVAVEQLTREPGGPEMKES